jgi:5-methylcytosine-specific restriction endonuclease McrA
MSTNKPRLDSNRLDRIVADARAASAEREKGYRERALKMYPWVCGRCAREFTRTNLQELTVHHRNHNHDDNPADGSNWELLCVYCHDNEHSRYIDNTGDTSESRAADATSNPFAALRDMMAKKNG